MFAATTHPSQLTGALRCAYTPPEKSGRDLNFMFFAVFGRGHYVNKNDLVAHVAETAGLSKADASKAVDAIFDGITTSLKNGDEVRLVGFGTFAVAVRAASEGRNPRTGEKITIPESKQPKFKAGKTLKDALN